MGVKRKSTRKFQRLDYEERIKRLAIIALVSDDQLLHTLVLKGGNALSIAYNVNTRASVDLDFSMEGEFSPLDLDGVRARIEQRLEQVFGEAGYVVFDVRMEERPPEVSPELAAFWGGYALEFKVIRAEAGVRLGGDIAEMRRRALSVGPRGRARFEIDISKFECCAPKHQIDLDRYTVFVYSPVLLAAEKLRAICQQMPEYSALVRRDPRPRARDFLDLHDIVHVLRVDLNTDEARGILEQVFRSKSVPLALLRRIDADRDFHRGDWRAVVDTVRPGVKLRDFDYYVDFVAGLVQGLEPLGDV